VAKGSLRGKYWCITVKGKDMVFGLIIDHVFSLEWDYEIVKIT
jgi:hypothetical protein